MLILADQCYGGIDGRILFRDCVWKSKLALIILKFSKIILRECNILVAGVLWKIFLVMCSDRFLVLVTYFRMWLPKHRRQVYSVEEVLLRKKNTIHRIRPEGSNGQAYAMVVDIYTDFLWEKN